MITTKQNIGFSYDQTIATQNNKIRIGVLYNLFRRNKQLPLIKTYNEQTEDFEYSKITNIYSLGFNKLIELRCSNRTLKCSLEQKYLTNNGWKNVYDLNPGTLIKTSEPIEHQILRSLNDDQEQVMLGSFLGDGNVSNHGQSRFRFRIIHGIAQKEYCEYKANILNIPLPIEYIEKNGYAQTPAVRFSTKMFGLEKEFPQTKTTCPQWILDKLDKRGLAIWVMDDGNTTRYKNNKASGFRISTCSFDEDSQKRFVEKLQFFGIECHYVKYDYFYICLSIKGYNTLVDLVSPYISDDLSYKIPQSKNLYKWNNEYAKYGYTVVDAVIDLPNEKKELFNIETANNNYIVCSQSRIGKSGIITYNC